MKLENGFRVYHIKIKDDSRYLTKLDTLLKYATEDCEYCFFNKCDEKEVK